MIPLLANLQNFILLIRMKHFGIQKLKSMERTQKKKLTFALF